MRLFSRFRLPCLPLQGLELVLSGSRPLAIRNAPGWLVRCTSGCVWVTAPGELADIYLREGETWTISSRGLVVVEGTAGAAKVLLDRSARSPASAG